MNLLIGTLYAGENEFEACIAAIRNQTYRNFDHIIIKDLPKRAAHQKLFRTFIDQREKYGILIKIDADTVLLSDRFFEHVVEKFMKDAWLSVMNVGVNDFFTGEMIPAGIQIYRNNVRWDFEQETIFTDIPVMKKSEYLYDKTELSPAADHNPNPTKLQSFHYGVHRGLKSIQRNYSTTHWANLQTVWKNFLKTGDTRIGLAVLGAELVYAGKFQIEDANYTNPKMKEVVEDYQLLSAAEIKKEIQKLRLRHWGWFPNEWRRRLIRDLRGRREGRWDN